MRAKLSGMIGRRFGCWIIESRAKSRNGDVRWNCLCDCGRRYIVTGYSLRTGDSSKCCYCRHTLPAGQAERNRLLSDYQRGAAKRGISWDLSEVDFDTLIQGLCHYCASDPSRRIKRKTLGVFGAYQGIDRVDSSKGYTKDNSVSCCGRCNRWKSDATVAEFKEHVKRIYDHLEKRNA